MLMINCNKRLLSLLPSLAVSGCLSFQCQNKRKKENPGYTRFLLDFFMIYFYIFYIYGIQNGISSSKLFITGSAGAAGFVCCGRGAEV